MKSITARLLGAKSVFGFALSTLLFALSVQVQAQRPAKIPRIGFLLASSPSTNAARIAAFRQGLRELDYEEGKNIGIEYRYAHGKMERLPELAAELVRLKVDVIVPQGIQPSQAAKSATSTIAIVFPGVGDPVGWGLIHSLARPGGNLTGFTNFSPALSGKAIRMFL